MRADGLLALSPRPFPYGPGYDTTDSSESLRERFQKTRDKYSSDLEFVAINFGPLDVAELEKLSTALFMLIPNFDSSDEEEAKKINEVKPHVSVAQGDAAVKRIRGILASA